MTRRPTLLILAALLAGCPAKPPGPAVPTPKAAATRKPTAALPAAALAKAMAGRETRAVAAGVATSLRGEVRLVSDHGGGIVSNNSGALVGKAKRALLQAAPAESRLADAVVTVHDANGRALTTADGKPIAALTDAQGRYELAADLPAENVVLRVRLWDGGELAAMRPRDGGAEAPIDTASSLGAAYVLGEFVKGDQATYDKLPAGEADALRAAIEAGRGALAGAPTYQPPVLLTTTADLRGKVPAIGARLDAIKALLLGQARIGEGLLASEVALPPAGAIAVDPRGHVFIADRLLGRVREIDTSGRLSTFADFYRGKVRRSFSNAKALASGPDGTLYIAQSGRIYALAPDGSVKDVAGDGRRDDRPLGGPALATTLNASSIAIHPDGTIYVADDANMDSVGIDEEATPTRLVAIGTDGIARLVPFEDGAHVGGLAIDGAGTLYVTSRAGPDRRLFVRGADGTFTRRATWAAKARDKKMRMAVSRDGVAYICSSGEKGVQRVTADGTVTIVAGPGAAGPAAIVDDAGKVAVAPDGTVYISDDGRNQVYALGPDEGWRVAAGANGTVTRSGDLTAISLNGPLGVSAGPDGGFVFGESLGYTVKRFDGAGVTTIAGAARGGGGDGGPATAARLDRPSAVVWHQGRTWIADTGNDQLRLVGTDGTIRSLAGNGAPGEQPGPRLELLAPGEAVPGGRLNMKGMGAIAVAPDGRVYLAMANRGQIWRVDDQGTVTHVAGKGYDPDEGFATAALSIDAPPPTEAAATAQLLAPSGLAFSPEGDLYVAETYACRIRKITGLAGATPQVVPFAGQPLVEAAQRLVDAEQVVLVEEMKRPFGQIGLAAPFSLACDAKGVLYAAMVGSRHAAISSDSTIAPAVGPPIDAHVARFGPDGKAQLIAGPGSRYFTDPDGEYPLIAPTGLAIDAQGRLAIADLGANLLHILPASALQP